MQDSTKLFPDSIADLVRRFGGPASNVLLDDGCQHFQAPGIDGIIGYKQYGDYAVVMGDPACAEIDREGLLQAFTHHCGENRRRCIYAVIGTHTATYAGGRGGALLEFGVEQTLNPTLALAPGAFNRDLRKKLKRARRAGMEVTEYPIALASDVELETQIQGVAASWLANRRGPQTYWAHIDLFRARRITRCFVGTVAGKVVGVLSTLRLDAQDGYLLEHLLCAPDAPVGASELLVTQALQTLGREGCRFATFGPAPASELGQVTGMSGTSARIARFVYGLCNRMFHLDAKVLFRQKFRPVAAQPMYLAFDPPVLQLPTFMALGITFNMSLPPSMLRLR